MKRMRSDIPGFYRLSMAERLAAVKAFAGLSDEECAALRRLDLETANRMIENVIGTVSLPLGIATNFLINGRDYLIPMAIDESSVVAAASNAAKLARPGGGFTAQSDEPMMIGQVQLRGVSDFEKARVAILEAKGELITSANRLDSTLTRLGGGLKDIEIRAVDVSGERQMIVHLLIDVRDAMGANIVNSICERLAPTLEQLSGGRALLRIVSNLATTRIARARAVWRADVLEESFDGKVAGKDVVDGIIDAYKLALADPYRCATHNKGIMNGIDAVMVATGNDWRAVEAGGHGYSRLTGSPLTRYERDADGNIIGYIEIPLACGIVGGATRMNPAAQICLKILGVRNSQELAGIAASVGLANNFAALRALAIEGIQAGHLKLHATNLAAMAGASGKAIDIIAQKMIQEGNVNYTRAAELLKEFKN